MLMAIVNPDLVIGAMLSALLGISAWTLHTVHKLAKVSAAREEKDAAQDQQIRENRARIMDIEEDVSGLQVDVAKLKERTGVR